MAWAHYFDLITYGTVRADYARRGLCCPHSGQLSRRSRSGWRCRRTAAMLHGIRRPRKRPTEFEEGLGGGA
jgi:hypothetical protein